MICTVSGSKIIVYAGGCPLKALTPLGTGKGLDFS